ncbi:MAG: glycine cleavage system protein GcvH [Victivallales bacterium]|nr:glycine cleavage system protein GcvH [Victivallales bacterium]
MKLYSKEHQWIEIDGQGVATVGISQFAVDELGEINFVELPEKGARIEADGILCVLESQKAATELIAPAGGIVLEGNAALSENPSLLNEKPEEEGWICRIKDAVPAQGLMTKEEYDAFLNG